MKNYEVIAHTADIGVRVKGKDIKELFKSAAVAMFDIIAEKKLKIKNEKLKIKIDQKTDNLEELLVNWLNELLSLSAVQGLIFHSFKIGKLSQNSLDAIVIGSKTKNYRINTEIKAATYHEVKLKKIESGWKAEVIFDV